MAGRWWPIKVAVVTAAISFVCQAPALEVKRQFFPTIVAQGRHLLRPLAVVNEASHEAKLAFRLVPPLLVDTLQLSVEGYYVLQAVLGLATLAGLAWLFHHVGYEPRTAALMVLGLALTYMGAVWFLDTQPYFDAIAASALVLAMCVPHPAVVFLAGSVALWTDERSLLALGVVALFHLHRKQPEGAIGAGIGFVAYMALRLWLGHRYGLSTGQDDVGPSVLFDFWTAMPLAILLALEGLWVVLGVAYVSALRSRQWFVVAAGVLTAGSIAASVMVNDVTRSTVFALPGVVFALVYLADRSDGERRWAFRGLAACAVIPTTAAIVVSGALYNQIDWLAPLPVRLIF